MTYGSIRGIAILLGLWHRAAGIAAQGREVTPKLKKEQAEVLKINYKVQSYRKAIWNKCVARRATCLSVKLVTCIQTLCYLQWASFILFNTDNFLASCSENRLSLLCNLLWWVGAGISAAFPSACIHPPLQQFSNDRHLLCNVRHLHFGKCTWEYILMFKTIWYPLVVPSSHLCFGLTLYKWCGQNQYKTFQGQVPHWSC